MDILEQLNDRQREAATSVDGACLILAGAGSGKTRAITYRIANLILNRGIPAWNILAVTFTNKAAGEMKDRVCALIGPANPLPTICTFHALGLRILRQEIKCVDRNSSFSIYDSADQKKAIESCLNILNLSKDNFPIIKTLSSISSLKDKMISFEEYEKDASGFYETTLAKIYGSYEEILKSNNAMDFDDLIFKTVELLRLNPQVREKWSKRFRYIMVDEYQDTNHSQYLLMKYLSENWQNLCVVGDEDQSIYGWRGADIRNILDFQKDFPDSIMIKLEENYRSTPTILSAAGAVIEKNSNRLGKTLWTRKEDGQKVMIVRALSDLEEADRIADKVKKLASRYSYSKIAVVYRTNAQSRLIEEAFMKNGLPYIIVGGTKFYDRKEIKDIVAYLRVISNCNDDVSLLRIINTPTRGIGKKSLDTLALKATQMQESRWNALKSIAEEDDRSLKPLQNFYYLMNAFINKSASRTLPSLIKFVIEETEYFELLKKQGEDEYQSRRENIESLVSAAAEFSERNEEATLSDFLDQISLVSHVDELHEGRGVNMMTIHCAKGLEFPVVFMAGMEENIFPHIRSLNDDRQLEEERRLCYVGMTRAMDVLYMSCAAKRRLYGQEEWNQPSRFLMDIPVEYMAEDNISMDFDKLLESEWDKPEVFDKSSSLVKGALVEHSKYGVGTVIKVEEVKDGEKVSISFQRAGIKKLHTKYARLKILRTG